MLHTQPATVLLFSQVPSSTLDFVMQSGVEVRVLQREKAQMLLPKHVGVNPTQVV